MTLAVAIALVETLFVFRAPPVGIESDLTGGVFAATEGEIFHLRGDSVVEQTSRVAGEALAGISDIAFSGAWLYALVPTRGEILKFDRHLRYVGRISVDIYSERMALSPSGDIWLLDPFRRMLVRFSSVGDPIESVRASGALGGLDDAVVVGAASWSDVKGCVDPAARSVPAAEVPVIWLASEGKLLAGFEYDAQARLAPAVKGVWICGGELVVATGDSIAFCKRGKLPWRGVPEDIAADGEKLYILQDDKLIGVTLIWR